MAQLFCGTHIAVSYMMSSLDFKVTTGTPFSQRVIMRIDEEVQKGK